MLSTSIPSTAQSPKPPPRPRACFSLPQAANDLGVPEHRVRRALEHSPRDGKGRIVSGDWRGAYQAESGRWHIPPATLAAVKAVQGRTAAIADLTARLDAHERRLAEIQAQVRRLLATLLLPDREEVA